jgi:hypothetical protein
MKMLTGIHAYQYSPLQVEKSLRMHKGSILICSALSHAKFLLLARRAAQIPGRSLQNDKNILVPPKMQRNVHPLSGLFFCAESWATWKNRPTYLSPTRAKEKIIARMKAFLQFPKVSLAPIIGLKGQQGFY